MDRTNSVIKHSASSPRAEKSVCEYVAFNGYFSHIGFSSQTKGFTDGHLVASYKETATT
jgi:hypothetical protein